ncbi:hypothetical protein QTG54_007146 [Skeletonema marinoi]|uniref:Uncharacterized protein n=1 Tax=Skeletonema marinoi TaxID=267567 RepID=A0AAD8YA05_9STRA|nr:hypothetical protein QTG54_007146 [Skeletonema marinoi]
MKAKVFRPHLDDVERLSYGKKASKRRGTGSRYHCHRLNQEERRLFELAKVSHFLTVRGNGYRKERKGSPLQNIWRQRSDALATLAVCVEKRSTIDAVVIDFSTLRVWDDASFVAMIVNNVLKAKYPDLHELLVEDAVVSSLIQTPINWDAIKTRPIWAINERLITIPCERDVAKPLAADVVKEGSQFILHEFQNERIDSTSHAIKQVIDYDGSDDESIDWNDI